MDPDVAQFLLDILATQSLQVGHPNFATNATLTLRALAALRGFLPAVEAPAVEAPAG